MQLYIFTLVYSTQLLHLCCGVVTSLTSKNFDSTLTPLPLALVKFTAPWCGHCKTLAPEFDKAADAMRGDNILFADVDATEEADLAARFKVSGYPTLKIFQYGESQDYKGGRTRSSIVDQMQGYLEAVKSFDDLESHDRWLREEIGLNKIVLTARVSSEDSKEYKTFLKFAEKFRKVVKFARIKKNVEENVAELILFRNFVTQSKKDSDTIIYSLADLTSEDKLLETLWREGVTHPVIYNDLQLLQTLRQFFEDKAFAILHTHVSSSHYASQLTYIANRLKKIAEEFPEYIFALTEGGVIADEADIYDFKDHSEMHFTFEDLFEEQKTPYICPNTVGNISNFDSTAAKNCVTMMQEGKLEAKIKSKEEEL